jgi:hypothetical protein
MTAGSFGARRARAKGGRVLKVKRTRLAGWGLAGLLGVACLALISGCTDVDVFETPGTGKGQKDDKLSVTGSFCTEHPDEMNSPVKIMFIIDCSQSMNVTDPPPSPNEYPGRVRAVWEVIQKFRYDPGVEFAIIRFEAAANVATQRDTNGDGVADMFGFTNDLATLLRALNSLQAAGGNTSYQAALGLAEATLAMDMSNGNVDERARTKYVVIFLSDGLPYPVDYDDEVNTPYSIRRAVREMMNLAKRFQVKEMTFHTAFLAVDTPQWVQDEAEALLGGMKDDGGGTFRNFQNGEEINFLDIDFSSVKRMYSMKDGAFLVVNANAHPGYVLDERIDTDGDGLIDRLEQELGTSVGMIDTDGDGFNDFLEYELRRSGFDALDPDDADCSLVLDRLDDDGDGLLNCEERFVGTSPDLFDTDADGIPDPVEIRTGTNPVWADADADLDFDGSLNASEVAWHTNPTANDAEGFSKLAYRYNLGRLPGTFESRMCYEFEVENISLVGTAARNEGDPTGYNDVLVYAGQIPFDDPDDYGTFRVACARVRYLPRYPEPDIKYPPNGRVEFEQKHFKRPVATACGSDEECPHHVCDPRDHLCLAPLGDACDEATPCPNFTCERDLNTGESHCIYPVATACLAPEDCPEYPSDPLTGLCMDPARTPVHPVTGACPRRECIPQYPTCAQPDGSDCPDDGDGDPSNDPICANGMCRVPCAGAAECNPGETCDLDTAADYPPCASDVDCAAGLSCHDSACRLPCATSAECPTAGDTCEANLCTGRHCVDHHGGTCARLECASEADCPQQGCDPEVGRCRTQPCLDSRDCPYERCEPVLGLCLGSTCAADADCRGERGFTCNEVVGGPCDRDIDCSYNFCSQEVFRCSMGGAGCQASSDCPANTCGGNLTCTLSGNDCVNNLDCVPNTCRSFFVCANDPNKGCILSLDCPQTFCSTANTCINDPAIACNPATENVDNRCQVGMCSRLDGLGTCDTLGQEACAAEADCPNYQCNLSIGQCHYPTEVVCQNDAACPTGLTCQIPGGAQWGVCRATCSSDADCPRARCQGRCRPLDTTERQRCTDWFDADRDCLVFDSGNQPNNDGP